MVSLYYSPVIVIVFVSVMAVMGYYTNDIKLIAPLGSIIITGCTCGLCFIIEKCRNPDFDTSSILLPK